MSQPFILGHMMYHLKKEENRLVSVGVWVCKGRGKGRVRALLINKHKFGGTNAHILHFPANLIKGPKDCLQMLIISIIQS